MGTKLGRYFAECNFLNVIPTLNKKYFLGITDEHEYIHIKMNLLSTIQNMVKHI